MRSNTVNIYGSGQPYICNAWLYVYTALLMQCREQTGFNKFACYRHQEFG